VNWQKSQGGYVYLSFFILYPRLERERESHGTHPGKLA
jgi:hypothetical protein